MLSMFVIAFLPRSKHLLISWLLSPFAVILEPRKIKSFAVSIVFPSICREVMGPDAIRSYGRCVLKSYGRCMLSSVLAWRILRTGEPHGLPSMGSHRIRYDWSDLAAGICLNSIGFLTFYTSTNSVWEFKFFHFLCNIWYHRSLNF